MRFLHLLGLLIVLGVFGALAACGDDDFNADAASITIDISSLSDGGG